MQRGRIHNSSASSADADAATGKSVIVLLLRRGRRGTDGARALRHAGGGGDKHRRVADKVARAADSVARGPLRDSRSLGPLRLGLGLLQTRLLDLVGDQVFLHVRPQVRGQCVTGRVEQVLDAPELGAANQLAGVERLRGNQGGQHVARTVVMALLRVHHCSRSRRR